MNDWKNVEDWLYSHNYYDASRNMRDIKANRKAADLLREYELYNQLRKPKIHPNKKRYVVS